MRITKLPEKGRRPCWRIQLRLPFTSLDAVWRSLDESYAMQWRKLPEGRYQQGTAGGNPHQEHQVFWHPDELKNLDYKVREHALRGLFGEQGRVSYVPNALRPLGNILWLYAGLLVYTSYLNWPATWSVSKI